MASTVTAPALKTQKDVTAAPASTAPSVQLLVSSTTQIPVASVSIYNPTVGESPKHLVRMKDGTLVYLPENQLVQNGAVVMF